MEKLRPWLVVAAAATGLWLAYDSCKSPDDEAQPAATSSSPPPEPAAPVPQVFALDNGLDVEAVPVGCGGKLGVAVLFAVGSDHDPPEWSGMARVLERVLAGRHADARVQVGSDHTSWTIVASDLPEALARVAALFGDLDVDDAQVEAARGEVLKDIAQRRGGDPARTAVTLAAESVLPSRGRGRRGGLADEVNTIDGPALRDFWRAHFTPDNARLVVAGADVTTVRPAIEKSLGELSAGKPPALRPPGESTVIGTLVMGDAPTAVAWVVPAPVPGDPAFAAFLVQAARLLRADADGWEVRYDPIADSDELVITGKKGDAEPPEPAAHRIRADVRALLEKPLAPEDLADARARFGALLGEADDKRCLADPQALAVARARRAQLGPVDPKALDAVDAEALTAAAARFDDERTTAVIAGGEL